MRIIYISQNASSAVAPSITLDSIDIITASSVTCTSNIISDGGSTITARGIEVNIMSNFSGPYLASNPDSGTTGIFSSIANLLSPNTFYYVRAFAVNSAGVVYSNTLTFTTNVTATAPSISLTYIGNIQADMLRFTFNMSSDGGSPLTIEGIDVSTNINFSSFDNTPITSLPYGIYDAWLLRTNLPNSTYYVRVYAGNSYGTTYSNIISYSTPVILPPTVTTAITDVSSSYFILNPASVSNDGDCGTRTEVGTVVSTFSSPTNTSYNFRYRPAQYGTAGVNLQWGTTFSGLTSNVTYYIRSYSINSITGITYSPEVVVTTTGSVPVVQTSLVTVSSTSSIATGGYVSSSGANSIVSRGVVWGLTQNPTTTLNIGITSNGVGLGNFISAITGLTPNITYYVRAYATNNIGLTGYGEDRAFATIPPLIGIPPTRYWSGIALNNDGAIQAACVYDGYIYSTTNAWAGVTTESVGQKSWKDIAISGDGSIIVACTESSTIWKRQNGVWRVIRQETYEYCNDIAISSDGNYILAGTNYGNALVSSDGGTTFTVNSTVYLYATDVAMSPSGQFMILCQTPGYIYLSTNYGAAGSWNRISSGIGAQTWNDLAISDNGQIIYGVTADGKVYKSINTGASFSLIFSIPGTVLRGIDTSGDGSNVILAGADTQFYVSVDGLTFVPQGNTPRNWNDIVISGDGSKRTAVVYQGYIYTFNQ